MQIRISERCSRLFVYSALPPVVRLSKRENARKMDPEARSDSGTTELSCTGSAQSVHVAANTGKGLGALRGAHSAVSAGVNCYPARLPSTLGLGLFASRTLH
jgi:hypothetical protein